MIVPGIWPSRVILRFSASDKPAKIGQVIAHQIILSINLFVRLEPSLFFHNPKQMTEVTAKCMAAQRDPCARKNLIMSYGEISLGTRRKTRIAIG